MNLKKIISKKNIILLKTYIFTKLKIALFFFKNESNIEYFLICFASVTIWFFDLFTFSPLWESYKIVWSNPISLTPEHIQNGKWFIFYSKIIFPILLGLAFFFNYLFGSKNLFALLYENAERWWKISFAWTISFLTLIILLVTFVPTVFPDIFWVGYFFFNNSHKYRRMGWIRELQTVIFVSFLTYFSRMWWLTLFFYFLVAFFCSIFGDKKFGSQLFFKLFEFEFFLRWLWRILFFWFLIEGYYSFFFVIMLIYLFRGLKKKIREDDVLYLNLLLDFISLKKKPEFLKLAPLEKIRILYHFFSLILLIWKQEPNYKSVCVPIFLTCLLTVILTKTLTVLSFFIIILSLINFLFKMYWWLSISPSNFYDFFSPDIIFELTQKAILNPKN